MFNFSKLDFAMIGLPYFEKPFFSDYERRYAYLTGNMYVALDFLENAGKTSLSKQEVEDFYDFIVDLVVTLYQSSFEELSYFLVYKIFVYTKNNNIDFTEFLIKASKINENFTKVVLDIAKSNGD